MTVEAGSAPRNAIVTVGFATTVVMWALGYVCRMPPGLAPNWLVLILMLGTLVWGGFVLGRWTSWGWRGGAMAGLVSATVNLLILGSVLTEGSSPNAVVPSAVLWIPGWLGAGSLLGAAGAALGALSGKGTVPFAERASGKGTVSFQPDASWWLSAFAAVAALATLLVVIAGGLVTSADAGLAVPDWPNSFGSNMFLYPLSRMTGGVYYEHAHRLYGSLVGLTTIVLAIMLWRAQPQSPGPPGLGSPTAASKARSLQVRELGYSRYIRWFALALVALVITQGYMGGKRVTETNLTLAIVHGIVGQIFFACVGLVWAMTTRTWRRADLPRPSPDAATDRTLTTFLAVIVFLQLTLGALYRHLYTEANPMPWPASLHLILAAIVGLIAFVAGLRAWSHYRDLPILTRLGRAMVLLVSLQLALGFAALVAVLARRGDPSAFELFFATAHQANGALVLTCAIQLQVWTRRAVVPIAEPEAAVLSPR